MCLDRGWLDLKRAVRAVGFFGYWLSRAWMHCFVRPCVRAPEVARGCVRCGRQGTAGAAGSSTRRIGLASSHVSLIRQPASRVSPLRVGGALCPLCPLWEWGTRTGRSDRPIHRHRGTGGDRVFAIPILHTRNGYTPPFPDPDPSGRGRRWSRRPRRARATRMINKRPHHQSEIFPSILTLPTGDSSFCFHHQSIRGGGIQNRRRPSVDFVMKEPR
jgi:hypothetical protein